MSTKKLKIHFIGIGGIGVSALAGYYMAKGHKISGSDLTSSEITDALKKLGAKIFIGPHSPKTVLGEVDLVIYSPAIPANNPELKTAKKLGIKCQSYPQALGELTKQHFTIAVSGTHGKSTTTAMISLILIKAGLDPTVIIGTKLKEFGNSNFRFGKKTTKILNTKYKIIVIEADEHMASFLNYWPKIIVLTTIEVDHLDFYKNLNNILKTFKEYVSHLPNDGILIANRDDKNTLQITNNKKPRRRRFATLRGRQKTKFYSLKQPETKELKKILKIPGEHNVYNALAALTLARTLKIPDRISLKSLSEFHGSWRRFEIIKANLNGKKITIVSDYGHHPTKVRVTLKAAREKWPRGKIYCVYQPHQYQRTYYLFNDFVKVLRRAPVDKLIVTDIFDVAGRENTGIKKKVNSEKLVKAIKKNSVIYLPKEKVIDYLNKNLKGGEVVIIMGAGDIYKIIPKLKETSSLFGLRPI